MENLIRFLDMKKDESIERTFKGVAKHFRDIFSELTGGQGKGELVMQKSIKVILNHLKYLINHLNHLI